jgi:predicted nucleic acid-binding protein
VTVFIDSSLWFAAANRKDKNRGRAHRLMAHDPVRVTTDQVLVETWLLLNSRLHRSAAERFWDNIRRGAARVENVSVGDLEAAWAIGQAFSDQQFSLVDRTSFAVMERLGITRVASFDDDFAVYRYGRRRDRAFEVLRRFSSTAPRASWSDSRTRA